MAHPIKRFSMPLAGTLLVVGAVLVPLAAQRPHPKYQRDLPAALLRQATVTEASAAKTARAAVPNGRIQAVELENENRRLIYSYELKIAGHSGIEEINVNARTGAVVNTEHEGPASEKGEAKGEAGERGEGGEGGA